MNIFPLILSFFIAISPSAQFDCDGDQLLVTIRNNLNGDFALVTDLEEIDEGAFVVLDWNNLSLIPKLNNIWKRKNFARFTAKQI